MVLHHAALAAAQGDQAWLIRPPVRRARRCFHRSVAGSGQAADRTARARPEAADTPHEPVVERPAARSTEARQYGAQFPVASTRAGAQTPKSRFSRSASVWRRARPSAAVKARWQLSQV